MAEIIHPKKGGRYCTMAEIISMVPKNGGRYVVGRGRATDPEVPAGGPPR